jgi:hypothetical protein
MLFFKCKYCHTSQRDRRYSPIPVLLLSSFPRTDLYYIYVYISPCMHEPTKSTHIYIYIYIYIHVFVYLYKYINI